MTRTQLVARHAQHAVEEALADTRVVVVLGARQVGKSTLLEQVASAEGAGREILTLDNQAVREAASTDPAGFVAGLRTPVAIDEIQRVPDLMTEIKLRVDSDGTPGQFVITGSANLLEMKQVKESLAGRAEYLHLHPFSQGELERQPETFVPGLANGSFPAVIDAPVGRQVYAEIVARGGYPEATHERRIGVLVSLRATSKASWTRICPPWAMSLIARSLRACYAPLEQRLRRNSTSRD